MQKLANQWLPIYRGISEIRPSLIRGFGRMTLREIAVMLLTVGR